MNKLGLIISGNLTGFSRFYATANVNDLYKDVAIDFDNRNYVTFLSTEDKAYAISFSPAVIAVSLVTRILDSFRRPGILVVSILMPRRTKVELAANSQEQRALYQLLNELNDRFYEKNFINGMINQNTSVLKQDYYSDILANYVLGSDDKQYAVNSTLNIALQNQNIGYIQSAEENIALYLSSVCRRGYEGYHHIFIAQNAPQNIDEEPIEVMLYHVVIKNNGQRISVVRLSDRIPNLMPSEGEIDIDKDFTYEQVLNKEAGRVQANLQNETIELTYNFGREERTINFVFMDGTVQVPVSYLAPMVVYSTGERYNIPSDSYTFLGREITEIKKLVCNSDQYRIKQGSEQLDISRLKDGAIYHVYLEKKSIPQMPAVATVPQKKEEVPSHRYGARTSSVTPVPQNRVQLENKVKINTNIKHVNRKIKTFFAVALVLLLFGGIFFLAKALDDSDDKTPEPKEENKTEREVSFCLMDSDGTQIADDSILRCMTITCNNDSLCSDIDKNNLKKKLSYSQSDSNTELQFVVEFNVQEDSFQIGRKKVKIEQIVNTQKIADVNLKLDVKLSDLILYQKVSKYSPENPPEKDQLDNLNKDVINVTNEELKESIQVRLKSLVSVARNNLAKIGGGVVNVPNVKINDSEIISYLKEGREVASEKINNISSEKYKGILMNYNRRCHASQTAKNNAQKAIWQIEEIKSFFGNSQNQANFTYESLNYLMSDKYYNEKK